MSWIFTLAGIAALGALGWFIWKNHATPNHAGADGADTSGAGQWLARWAYLPEALSVALTLKWAYSAQSGAVMPWIFCAGFIAFVAFRAIAVPRAVDAIAARRWSQAITLASLAIGSLALLFSTSIFTLMNESDDGVKARIEASKPAAAMDREIEITREQLRGLAGFADPTKATAEARQIQDAQQQAQARVATLNATIREGLNQVPNNRNDVSAGRTLDALTGGCTDTESYYYKFCSPVVQARDELAQGSGPSSAPIATYGPRHAEYKGLQAHLVDLEKRRAELSESGEGIQSAYKAEDRAVASIIGTTPETASWIKWLLYAAAFDLLALLARIGAAMLNPRDNRAIIQRKINALLDLGIDPTDNLRAALAGAIGGHQPATAPQYRHGGAVHHHGLAELHGTPDRPEYVLSPEMTDTLGGADVLEALRRRVHDVGATTPLNDPVKDTTPLNDPVKDTTSLNDPVNTTSYGTGVCRHCGATFKRLTWNHAHCSESCRVAAWEARTGRKLKKGRK